MMNAADYLYLLRKPVVRRAAVSSVAAVAMLFVVAAQAAPVRLERHVPIRRAATPLLYVADNINEVLIYNQATLGLVGTITNGLNAPAGDYVDANGNLWVANFDGNNVTEYAPGGTSPINTLSNGISGPTGVLVGLDGTVYVAEPNVSGIGSVVEFAGGSSAPTAVINRFGVESVWLDAGNDLLLAYADSDFGTHVDRFPPGSTNGTNIINGAGTVGQVAVDTRGNILVANQSKHWIAVYHAHKARAFRRINVPGRDPFHFALDSTETTLYVADPQNSQVAIYNYQTGAALGTLTPGVPTFGVTVSPAAPF
jgi:sugar lactone lactonase YvrE